METKYPALRRPKRKLCYQENKESPSKKWIEPLTIEDVERMFDDMDPSSHDDLRPPSPLLEMTDAETNLSEREVSPVSQKGHLTEQSPKCQMGPEGDVLHPATRSPIPKLDIDLDFPFKAHGPVKTSSPIEENLVVEGVDELDNEKDHVVSPILFACEDEGKEEEKTEPPPTLKPQFDGHIQEESNDCELESPPSKVALRIPKMSSHKNKMKESRKKSLPVKENAPNKPQTPVLEDKRKTARQENTDPPVSAVSQEPKLVPSKLNSESDSRQPSVEVSTRVGKDMTAFLQKLRDARQPKPACSRKSLSPVKVPTPTEPEDDFLILEDDTPLWFSIPSKTATSKRQRQSRTYNTEKCSSSDKETNDSPLETAQKQQESEKANDKLGSQTVNQKMKKMKEKKNEKKNEVTEPGNDKNELCSPEDIPACDLMEQEKPNKKNQKRPKKVPSKESDMGEEQHKDTTSRETDEEKSTLKMEKKAQKSSDMKRSKSIKDRNENAKTSRVKSLKGPRKGMQGSDAVKETVYVEAVEEQSQEHAGAEDLGSLSDKEINSEAQMDVKNKENNLLVESERSSSEDCQFLGKRKRRQTGHWWLSNPQSKEETEVINNQATLKKSKRNNKEPSTAVPSPVKAKKGRVLKRKTQTQPASSSSQNRNKAKEKKNKQNKNRNTIGDTPEKMKATDEAFGAIEAEQNEEQEQQQQQQEVPDQDLDPLQSSPLVLTHRDHSHNSGDQVFQRVYHHVSNEKLSITPVAVSPRGSSRRRKYPGNWWAVDGTSKDVESISSQPQQQEPKPRKERKKQSKQSRSPRLGTPKNGNVAVSSKPLGGAPVPLLKVKPLSTPKSVKRSLAQNNRRKVTERPAEEVTVTDCTALSMTDAGESSSPPDHEDPQDSKYQSDNTLKAHKSGPSSMIELEQYEENDDLILPSSRVHAVLSASDLCAPPLKPLILQPKDKANLMEWFKSLWSTSADHGPEITPDEFDWYFYQGRAIGFLVDLNCGSICNGKILLGSYMKKPLWVDHSATTVFNLLTSSVSVTIDGSESRFNPGQSFMVPCGHAYSIKNVTAQPAVLYFTRILAESSD